VWWVVLKTLWGGGKKQTATPTTHGQYLTKNQFYTPEQVQIQAFIGCLEVV
jgi:hypothetical protein